MKFCEKKCEVTTPEKVQLRFNHLKNGEVFYFAGLPDMKCIKGHPRGYSSRKGYMTLNEGTYHDITTSNYTEKFVVRLDGCFKIEKEEQYL